MLKRLQQKWNVKGGQLFIILCVFAITGTTTAWLTKVIIGWVGFTEQTYWLWKLLLRLGMLVIGYQLILLSVAFLLGQFAFFWKFEQRMLSWLTGKRLVGKQSAVSIQPLESSNRHSAISQQDTITTAKISNLQMSNLKSVHLAIFASGTGSNAQKIIDSFRNHPLIKVSLVVSNKPDAGVLQIAQKEQINTLIINKEQFFRGNAYADELKAAQIDWVILAGFLWKVPIALIQAFPDRIINIHPALLPKYGGKGMYGHFVHEAVLAAGEKESGITIHYVDEHFDHGNTIFQAVCVLDENDTPLTIAKKVQVLEHAHYPEVIERLVTASQA